MLTLSYWLDLCVVTYESRLQGEGKDSLFCN